MGVPIPSGRPRLEAHATWVGFASGRDAAEALERALESVLRVARSSHVRRPKDMGEVHRTRGDAPSQGSHRVSHAGPLTGSLPARDSGELVLAAGGGTAISRQSSRLGGDYAFSHCHAGVPPATHPLHRRSRPGGAGRSSRRWTGSGAWCVDGEPARRSVEAQVRAGLHVTTLACPVLLDQRHDDPAASSCGREAVERAVRPGGQGGGLTRQLVAWLGSASPLVRPRSDHALWRGAPTAFTR